MHFKHIYLILHNSQSLTEFNRNKNGIEFKASLSAFHLHQNNDERVSAPELWHRLYILVFDIGLTKSYSKKWDRS